MLSLRDSVLGLTSQFGNLESQVNTKIDRISKDYHELESKLVQETKSAEKTRASAVVVSTERIETVNAPSNRDDKVTSIKYQLGDTTIAQGKWEI